MERVIKEVKPVPFVKRLTQVSEANMFRLAFATMISTFIFISLGRASWILLIPYFIFLPAFYLSLKLNQNFVFKIVIDDEIIRLDYVDSKMIVQSDTYSKGNFRSMLNRGPKGPEPLFIRFFSGKFRTEEVLIQPVTKHWPLSELERVHAEIMAVVPPIGLGDGVK